jgi:hypothetical protein
MKQNICSAITSRLFKLVVAAFVLLFPLDYALAADCELKNNPLPFIRHDLTGSPTTSVSFCELCSYGYEMIVITNPCQGVDMINMKVVKSLGYAPHTGMMDVQYG